MEKRMTITEVAKAVGISAKTITRWEKSGKIQKAKRDFRGWRIYHEKDVDVIRSVHEQVFEV